MERSRARRRTCSTVQGELLRSVERLRDEAQQNANANYRRDHKKMAVFVRNTLVRSGIFDQGEISRIQNGTHLLMKASRPYTKNDVFDHLVDQVCVFYTRNPNRYLSRPGVPFHKNTPGAQTARRPVW